MSEQSPIVEKAIQALKEQRPAEAAAILKDHIWRDPSDGVAYAFLGVALSEQGDTPSALEALERAHYLNPQDAGILYNYGLVLEAAGRPKEARIRFNAALRIDPDYRRALQRLAMLDAGSSPTPAPPAPAVETSVPPATTPTVVRQPVEPPARESPAPPADRSHSEVNGHTPADAGPDDPPARTAPAPGKKWARERANRGEEGDESGDAAPAAAPSPREAAPPSASTPGPAPGSAAPDPAPADPQAPQMPQMPFAFPAPSAPAVSWIDQGAVLLKNRWVVIGLCAVFTVGGLVAGIAIRGAGSPAPPGSVDPLASRGLRRGNLAGAELANLPLSGLNFTGENLQRVRAEKADLSNANLTKAELREARLEQADLTGADLSNANLARANLLGVRGRGAKFTGAFLRGAYMKASVFREADFQSAYLSGTNLGHADLSAANLSGADLRGAYMMNAMLIGTVLTNSRLQGANLSKARLERALLKGARFDRKTVWPTGFNPRSRGAVYETPATAAASPAGKIVPVVAATKATAPPGEPHTRP